MFVVGHDFDNETLLVHASESLASDSRLQKAQRRRRPRPRLLPQPIIANDTPRKPSTLFFVDPDADDETLLANTCESLASASVMCSNFAGLLVLGIQQVVMLGELAVNRMLDRLDPP